MWVFSPILFYHSRTSHHFGDNMKRLAVIITCFIAVACHAQMDKVMFNVSAVTTGALVESSSPGVIVGNLKRIIVDIDETKANNFKMRLYADSVYTGEKITLFTSDSITTNISVMPLYGAVDSENATLTNQNAYVEFPLFEDQITLAVGESASTTNSSAKVTVIFERLR